MTTLKNINPIALHKEALENALVAQQDFLEQFGETPYCGFAWVTLYEDGRSPFVKALVKAGIASKSWGRGYVIWNPTNTGSQSMDLKEVACDAYAQVFRNHGVKAYMGSRPD